MNQATQEKNKEVFALESRDQNGHHSGYLLFPTQAKGESFIDFVSNIKGMSSGHIYCVVGHVAVSDYIHDNVMKKSQFYVKSLS